MKFIHTADLHLTNPASPAGARRLKALEEICALAAKHDALVIAGDMFDSAGEAPGLERELRRILTSIRPVPVIIIPGNHDLLRGQDPFAGALDFGQDANVRVLTGAAFKTETVAGVEFYGFPFCRDKSTSELLAGIKVPPGSVAVMHGTPSGRPELAGFAADPDNAEEGGDFLIEGGHIAAAGFAYAALGHIHKPGMWRHGDTLLCYPGSPDAVRITETGPRAAALVTINNGAAQAAPLALVSGAGAVRKIFLVFPGSETEVFAKIETFFEQNSARRAGAVVEGIADTAEAGRLKASVLTRLAAKFPGSQLEIKIKAADLKSAPDNPVLSAFTAAIRSAGDKTAAPEETEQLARALALGWRAAAGQGLAPDDILECG